METTLLVRTAQVVAVLVLRVVMVPTVKQQVMAVEKQAEQWLATYHKEVTGQIQDRMGKWDEVSRQYADGMLNTVNAIQGVVDELESKAR